MRNENRINENRIKVTMGEHKIGDAVKWGPYETRVIKSFGKSWTAVEYDVPAKHWRGSLYQECDYPGCHNEPVELDTEMRERHHPESVKSVVVYGYAYFE